SWLPKAGVAPTPVTALLHAVAVVKSGAFAIIRLTYYSFGVRILKGTFAQYIPMAFAIFTIVYGCSMAVKERHIKRRFAYSTISNLSYVLFAALLMTPLGMTGALTHMVFHGVMKIASFFCAGAVIVKAHKTYVYELEGFGKKMPKTFFVMSVSALALMGVPGLCGFISKWQIAKASIDSATVGGYVGLAALLISALLTAIYMLQILIRAYFPTEKETVVEKCDPSFRMLVPLYAFTIAMVVLGAYSTPLISFFEKVAGGMM
nr:proton-conducting membrane transporter [Lachnospiraceae bacterium]